jgi:hypothetical protein
VHCLGGITDILPYKDSGKNINELHVLNKVNKLNNKFALNKHPPNVNFIFLDLLGKSKG